MGGLPLELKHFVFIFGVLIVGMFCGAMGGGS